MRLPEGGADEPVQEGRCPSADGAVCQPVLSMHAYTCAVAVTGWGPHLLLRALRQHSGRGQAVGKAWHGHGHFRR
eukprot:COSAG01_NODE_18721_length_1057_cov_64.937370_1_plen_74_part_10